MVRELWLWFPQPCPLSVISSFPIHFPIDQASFRVFFFFFLFYIGQLVCRCEHLSSSLRKFQLYSTLLSTVVTLFYVRSSLIHLVHQPLPCPHSRATFGAHSSTVRFCEFNIFPFKDSSMSDPVQDYLSLSGLFHLA